MRLIHPDPRRRPGPLARLALAIGALAGLHAALAGCRGTPGDAPGVHTVAEASYVGDEACASCHEDVYASYKRTGMGRSVTRFDPATAVERFDAAGRSPVVCHEPTGYCYEAFVRGDTLYQRETRPDTPGWARVHPVSHVVGSGNATRSYFMTVAADGGGYVTEMPLTYYVERAVWDLSPGYHQTNARFARPITLECMACHNGPPGFAEGTQNFYTHVPLGISCERCHGPASVHVEARLEGGGDPARADPTIVNPARLSPSLQLAACQQCHLSGTTVFAEGESPLTYRPGQPLAENRRVFVTAERLNDPEHFGISSHAERLMRSPCFIASQDSARPMTCTTCHDPHVPTAEMGPDHFNASCRSCHGADLHQAVCSRPTADTRVEATGGDCVSCHLRQSGTSDIPHVTFTDHWIRRTIPPAAPGVGASAEAFVRDRPFELVDVTAREAAYARSAGAARADARGEAESELARGIATFVFYDTSHRIRAYLPEVVRILRSARTRGTGHPDAFLYLGRALIDLDSLAAAERVLAEAVRAAPDDPVGHYWLGEARLLRGDAPGAVAALAEAVRVQPRRVEARRKHAEALAAVGRPDAALAELRAATALDPVGHPAVWNDLGFLLLQRGRLAEATSALERAVTLDPRMAEAQANLGAVLLSRDDAAGAAHRLEAALRVRPDYAPALGNLGVAYLRLGRPADARRQFERLLALDPRDRQAAAYLEEIGR